MEYSQRLIQRVVDTQEYYKNLIKDMTYYLADIDDTLKAFNGLEFNQENAEALATALSQGHLRVDVNILKDKMIGSWSLYGVYIAPGELPFDTRCIDMYIGEMTPAINAVDSLYHISIDTKQLVQSIYDARSYNLKRWRRVTDFDVQTWTANRELVERHLDNLKDALPREFKYLNHNTDLEENGVVVTDEEAEGL